MSVLTREKRTRVQGDAVNVTTDYNPIMPGAVTLSGIPEPQVAVSTTPLPQAGAVSHTALPIFGAVNVTSPCGDVKNLTENGGKVDEDGCPL